MLNHLVGHESIKRLLAHMLDSGQIPQTMLFYGESGVGKAAFARSFAQQLVKSKKQEHPDIRIYSLEEEQSSHTIASIRQLKEEVYLPPFEAEYKVFIIEDAHKMLPASSNALLKTLEEPSSDCKIILVAPSLSDLLPTVVSRCCKIPFAPLHHREITEFLIEQHHLSREEACAIAYQSCGSLKRAVLFAQKEERGWYEVLSQTVLKFKECCVDQIHKQLSYLEEEVEKRKTCSKEAIYEHLLRLIRDLVVVKRGLDPSFLLFKDQESQLKSAASRIKISADQMQELWQEGYQSLACHVKLKVGLEQLLMRLYG